MPYARRRIGARTGYRRNTRRTYSRLARKKVVRTRRAIPYRKKSSATAMARKALNLARFNSKLARGSYQTNLHYMNRGVHVKSDNPMCFHVPTPRQKENIYQFLQVGTTTPPVYAATVVAQFEVPTVQQLTTGDPTSAGMPEHNFWAESNDDKLNGKYYLQTINYSFTVSSVAGQNKAIRYRVDFVTPNRGAQFRAVAGSLPLGIDQSNYKLPDTLGSFNGILGHVNRINPMYWSFARKPCFFTVAPHENAVPEAQTIAKTVQKHVKLNVNKTFNPRDVGTTAADQGSAYLSLPDNQQVWCVISSDASGDDSIVPTVFVTRQFSWRDRAGHAV